MIRAADEEGASSLSEAGRLDRWLWFARVVKSRTLAAGLVQDGKVRINRAKVSKPSQAVRAGDVLTIRVGPRVRVLKVVKVGERRGPSIEAQTLYEEVSVHLGPVDDAGGGKPAAERAAGSGRPTKRDRRRIEQLKRE